MLLSTFCGVWVTATKGGYRMVRKVISCALMGTLFIGGMVLLVLGAEVLIAGTGGAIGPWMVLGGALLATAGAVTLAEDFAAAYLGR